MMRTLRQLISLITVVTALVVAVQELRRVLRDFRRDSDGTEVGGKSRSLDTL